MRFLFYDRILEMEVGKHALATKMVSLAEEYFTDHYSRRALMPVTIIIESLAQVAGWLNLASNNFNVTTVLCLIEGVSINREVRSGDSLLLDVRALYLHPDGMTTRGEVRIGSEVVMTVERMVFANATAGGGEFIERERERFNYLSGGFKLAEGAQTCQSQE
jgi:3-hydroxyacyl-[acyl-carrier-protein] dehydratase